MYLYTIHIPFPVGVSSHSKQLALYRKLCSLDIPADEAHRIAFEYTPKDSNDIFIMLYYPTLLNTQENVNVTQVHD